MRSFTRPSRPTRGTVVKLTLGLLALGAGYLGLRVGRRVRNGPSEDF
jgi:hypothetical protein